MECVGLGDTFSLPGKSLSSGIYPIEESTYPRSSNCSRHFGNRAQQCEPTAGHSIDKRRSPSMFGSAQRTSRFQLH
jgi:hypothetical protein